MFDLKPLREAVGSEVIVQFCSDMASMQYGRGRLREVDEYGIRFGGLSVPFVGIGCAIFEVRTLEGRSLFVSPVGWDYHERSMGAPHYLWFSSYLLYGKEFSLAWYRRENPNDETGMLNPDNPTPNMLAFWK